MELKDYKRKVSKLKFSPHLPREEQISTLAALTSLGEVYPIVVKLEVQSKKEVYKPTPNSKRVIRPDKSVKYYEFVKEVKTWTFPDEKAFLKKQPLFFNFTPSQQELYDEVLAQLNK